MNIFSCKDKTLIDCRGFTLIEMMVAVSLFVIVMTMSVGALLDLVSANRKSQALQSVMNNLNVALDGVVRNVRMGTNYHCGNASTDIFPSTLSTKADCVAGGNLLAFEPFGGSASNTGDQVVYWIENKRLYKSTDSRATKMAMTAPEIDIDSFSVYVTGAEKSLNADLDKVQPKVVFVISGTAGAAGNTKSTIGTKKKIRTTFHIQAVATQRVLDL